MLSATRWGSRALGTVTPPAPALYFDSAAAPGGDGSLAAPYNTLTPLTSLSGNLGGMRVRLKAGSMFRERLFMFQCSNFLVEPYDGLFTEVRGSNAVNPASWVAVGDGSYYLTGITKHHAIHIPPLTWLAPAASLGALTFGTQFHDTGTSRLYVRLPGDADPALFDVEITQRAECVRIEECSDYGVDGIIADRSEANNISLFRTGNNVTVNNIVSDWAGSWDPADAGNGLFITGTSAAVRASNITVTEYFSAFNKNNHAEIWWLDGAVFSGTQSGQDGNGFEPWAACTNVTIRRHRSGWTTGRGNSTARRRGMWMVGDDVVPGVTGGHGTIRVESTTFDSIDGNALEIRDGICQAWNLSIYNCGNDTTPEAIVAEPSGSGNAGIVIRNSIGMCQQANLYYLIRVAPASVPFSSSDYNTWYCTRGFDTFASFVWGGSSQSNGDGAVAFAAHQAATGQDANSQFANPLFVDPSLSLFDLQVGSPAIGSGISAGAPTLDLIGNAFASPPSAGALEYQP